jgi:hypothetical protein
VSSPFCIHSLGVLATQVCSVSGRNFKHHRDLWRLDLDRWIFVQTSPDSTGCRSAFCTMFANAGSEDSSALVTGITLPVQLRVGAAAGEGRPLRSVGPPHGAVEKPAAAVWRLLPDGDRGVQVCAGFGA